MVPAVIIPAGLLVDRLIGDPDSRYHPVALLGRLIGWWGRPSVWSPKAARIAGILMWIGTVFLFALPFLLFSVFAPWYLYVIIAPFLLKICLAWRSLEEHAERVIDAVRRDLGEGRGQVSMMVSRDSRELSREQVLSAGYESMTENLVDSIISPLFFFGLAGLTGAAVYRAANTMDAMLGYKDERKDLGWWPARMDDLLNYIPARITGGLLLLYFACKGRFRQAWHTFREDGKKRPGYNGGIPMAIMAGGTGIVFEKPGIYRIGPGVRSFDEAGPEIFSAVRVVTLVFAGLLTGAVLLLQVLLIM
ncbi:MAG TPA: adenosylcobinamide-phosphate synthase CbiB [Methanoregulaceae archaeon]|nr:adenosylcobinamide-phosphate synthase CbiB [Methanoregulaceae archaeon]